MLPALRGLIFAFPFEYFKRLAVCQARVRADERGVNLVARKLRPLIDIQINRHRAAYLTWGERAQPARKLLGNHRDHPIDQIHARGTASRRQIERAPPFHVMRDIGDVHADAPEQTALILHLLDGERVIEISCIIRVDGEHETLAQVTIARRERPNFVNRGTTRLHERSVGERRLELMAGNDGINPLVEPVDMLEHFLDMPRRRGIAGGELRDANADNRAVFHIGGLGELGEDVVGDMRVERHDDAEWLGHLEPADNDLMGTLDHRDDARSTLVTIATAAGTFSRAALRGIRRQRGNFDQIAVEGASELGVRNEEFAF